MTKTMTIVVLVCVGLIGSSMAALVTQPSQQAKTRLVSAGRATLQLPLHVPGQIKTGGTTTNGAVIVGSKDDCDVTYDHFAGIYWADRRIAGSALLPTAAYQVVSEKAGTPLDMGNGIVTPTRIITLTAEKPCGKIVEETLNVVDLYCGNSKSYYAVTGMQDPFMTRQRLGDIARSLKCS